MMYLPKNCVSFRKSRSLNLNLCLCNSVSENCFVIAVTVSSLCWILLQINFKSHLGDQVGDTYIPSNPQIEGNCQEEDSSSMTISWKGYTLEWNFEKVGYLYTISFHFIYFSCRLQVENGGTLINWNWLSALTFRITTMFELTVRFRNL